MTDVVIPACNEAATIGAVIDACSRPGAVSEVIVVANGCTDDTVHTAERHGAFVVTTPEADKGAAMALGLDYVTTERVLFCDADLIGLRAEHVAAMVHQSPLGGQLCGVTDTPAAGLTKFLPPITGQRRLPTAFARKVRGSFAGSGYGAELRIDAAVGRGGLPHKSYVLRGVTNPTRAFRDPLRFVRMTVAVTAETAYLFPDLLAYERGGLG